MPGSNSETTAQLRGLIERLRKGDESAKALIIERAANRLRRMASAKLNNGFSKARRQGFETDDVAQEVSIKLMTALGSVPVDSVAGFFGLVTKKMTEVLLDTVRKHEPPGALGAGTTNSPDIDPPVQTDGPATLAEWTDLHAHVQTLPEEPRTVFIMVFYCDMSQAEVAEALNVSERTVKRYWRDARLALADRFEGELPGE